MIEPLSLWTTSSPVPISAPIPGCDSGWMESFFNVGVIGGILKYSDVLRWNSRLQAVGYDNRMLNLDRSRRLMRILVPVVAHHAIMTTCGALGSLLRYSQTVAMTLVPPVPS